MKLNIIVILLFLIITFALISNSNECGFGVGCSPGTCGCGGPCGRRKRSVSY